MIKPIMALTYVDSCRVLNIPNELYILNKSLNGNNCINITASNITFNGNFTTGKYLNGTNTSGAFGIKSNASQTTIMNTNVTNFGCGVFLNNSDGSKLMSNFVFGTASGNLENGTQTIIHNSKNVILHNHVSIGTSTSALAINNVKGLRIGHSRNVSIFGNSSGGTYIYNTTDLYFRNYNNSIDRLALFNDTNIDIENMSYSGTVSFTTNQVTNITINNLILGKYQTSSAGVSCTRTDNFILKNSQIFGPTNAGTLNYVSGYNITINGSTIYGFNGNAQGLIIGTSTSNTIIENSNLSIDNGNSGQGGLVIQGQNVSVNNITSRIRSGNAQYIVSITSTAKNVVITNANIQTLGTVSSTGNSNLHGLLLGGTNVTIKDSVINLSYTNVASNITTNVGLIADSRNIYLQNIRIITNNSYNLSRAMTFGLRSINITLQNITASAGFSILGNNITNVTNLRIQNSVFESRLNSTLFLSTNKNVAYNISLMNTTISGYNLLNISNDIYKPILWLRNSSITN